MKLNKILAAIKKCSISVIFRLSKNNVIIKKICHWKKKDEAGSIAIEEIVLLKPKMYSFLADNSQHKKGNKVNRNDVATISHNEYKDVLLNNKCIRNSINKTQN